MKKRNFVGLLYSAAALFAGIAYLVICIHVMLFLWTRVFHLDPTKNMAVFVVTEIAFLLAVAVIVSLVTKPFFSDKESLFWLLADRPGSDNYKWQGGFSIFSGALLWAIMIMRSISTLQFCKSIFRTIARSDTDYASKRPNISPSFQEVYFLIWGAFLVIQVSCGLNGAVYYALDIYFIMESLTWVLYYAVFRRFFEEKYSIYHVLEHLPTIILILPLQAIAYAVASVDGGRAVTWGEILPILLGQADNTHSILSMAGFLYTAIVVGMIISSFPVERVKTGIPKTIIIGAGDVVRARLLPAMIRRNERNEKHRIRDLEVYTLETIEDLPDRVASPYPSQSPDEADAHKKWIPQKTKSIYELISDPSWTSNTIAWIETPSDTHLYYLELLKDEVGMVAVEKPLAAGVSDLILMNDIISSEQRHRIFFLSYYILEKALILTFLRRPKRFYLKYFNGPIDEFYQAYLELGKVLSVNVEIVEEPDHRDLPAGGQVIETFIHNCLIASLFAGLPGTWKIDDNGYARKGSEEQLIITLKAGGENGEDIGLTLVKGFDDKHPVKKQTARIEFENGVIFADFDERKASIRNYKNEAGIEVKIGSEYRRAYDVQCDMVNECYLNHIDPAEVDGLFHQVEVLEWMLKELIPLDQQWIPDNERRENNDICQI